MQQKLKVSGLGTVLLLVAVGAVGGMVALMMTHIPAPQHHVEKQLDAKAFFEQKQ